MIVRIEQWREALARKLIKLAIAVDPGNSMLYQAGEYKLEIGWKQPKSNQDFCNPPINFIVQGNDINGDTGL
jgi:hypothetical protein